MKKTADFTSIIIPIPPGTVDPSYKLIYGNSFALYALSEYARINTDPAVLEWVKKTFTWLETYAHDPFTWVILIWFCPAILFLLQIPDQRN